MNFNNPSLDIIKNKKLFVFDMDGTVYLGGIPFEFAKRFILNLRKAGKRVLFFTNNASHTDSFYINKLNKMGFDVSENEIMTSGDVTVEFLNRHRIGRKVYLLGVQELIDDFSNKGIDLISGKEEKTDIVVTSFDTTLTYEKLDNACRLIRNGAEFFSTHPDFNCPTETGFIPDSGAITAFITASTGKTPTYFGKPYRETIEMIAEATGVDKSEMCIFGDRLYTDIALGKKFGVTSVLVLSGETQPADVEAALDTEKPDFVFNSLDDLDREMFS